MEAGYSLRSPAVKRLMKEAQELKDPTEQFFAQPLDDNLFEWHFTVRGPADSEFENGIYHGRIILPPEYPMKPPSIILLTPNGRFETHKKICLSISGHHPESWQPSWSLRTALLAIIGFMPTHGNGAIGSLDYTADERKVLARKSLDWNCPNCGPVQKLVLPVTEASKALNKEAKELGTQINLQGEKEKSGAAASSSPEAATTDPSPVAGDQSAGAAGPLPPSETAPAFPPFPYPVNPHMMIPANAGQHPNAMGYNPLNPNYPVMPPMFMPPVFMPNMFYNPLFMPPRPPGAFAPPMYAPQGYPGYPMPRFWMGPGPIPPAEAVRGTDLPNTMSQPSRNTVETSTGADHSDVASVSSSSSSQQPVSSTSSCQHPVSSASSSQQPVSSTGSSQQSVSSTGSTQLGSTKKSPSGLNKTPVLKSDSETTSVSPEASGAENDVAACSSKSAPSSLQPSLSTASSQAGATSGAGASTVETGDPVPSASELRQRNVTRDSNQAPSSGHVRRTNQPAEIHRGQPSVSSHIGHLLLNILVAILVLCIVALLSRRLYLLG